MGVDPSRKQITDAVTEMFLSAFFLCDDVLDHGDPVMVMVPRAHLHRLQASLMGLDALGAPEDWKPDDQR